MQDVGTRFQELALRLAERTARGYSTGELEVREKRTEFVNEWINDASELVEEPAGSREESEVIAEAEGDVARIVAASVVEGWETEAALVREHEGEHGLVDMVGCGRRPEFDLGEVSGDATDWEALVIEDSEPEIPLEDEEEDTEPTNDWWKEQGCFDGSTAQHVQVRGRPSSTPALATTPATTREPDPEIYSDGEWDEVDSGGARRDSREVRRRQTYRRLSEIERMDLARYKRRCEDVGARELEGGYVTSFPGLHERERSRREAARTGGQGRASTMY
ncbi:hypothetical protein P7C70_g7790, partial [Phenoliferia sp. Uapishka_3]